MIVIDLSTVTQQAGLSPEAETYLHERGIRTPSTLAMMGADVNDFMLKVVDKFRLGWTAPDGTIHKMTGDTDVEMATMIAAWQISKKMHADATAGALQGQQLQTQQAQPQTSAKVPTTLPPGIWAQQIRKYNSVTVGSTHRKFPEELLAGADKVLARLYHEKHVSGHYTPIKLGEILATRSMTASGEVNKMAEKADAARKWDFEEGAMVERQEHTWDPGNLLAVQDALTAVKWAWILFEYAPQESIENFTAFFDQMVRSKPHKLHQIKELWTAAGWRMALAMRRGETFCQTTSDIMKDSTFIHDKLNSNSYPTTPKGRQRMGSPGTPEPRRQPRGAAQAKGGGRGRSRSARNEYAKEYNKEKPQPGKQWQQDKAVCTFFQDGKCDKGEWCKYDHKCKNCGKTGHGKAECWAPGGAKADNPKGKGKGKKPKQW